MDFVMDYLIDKSIKAINSAIAADEAIAAEVKKAIVVGSADFWDNRRLGGKVIDSRDLLCYLHGNLTESEIWFKLLQCVGKLRLVENRDYTICYYDTFCKDGYSEVIKVAVLSIHAALKIVRFEKKNPKSKAVEAYLQEAYEGWMDEIHDAIKLLKQQLKGNLEYTFDLMQEDSYDDVFPLPSSLRQ